MCVWAVLFPLSRPDSPIETLIIVVDFGLQVLVFAGDLCECSLVHVDCTDLSTDWACQQKQVEQESGQHHLPIEIYLTALTGQHPLTGWWPGR